MWHIRLTLSRGTDDRWTSSSAASAGRYRIGALMPVHHGRQPGLQLMQAVNVAAEAATPPATWASFHTLSWWITMRQ